MSFDYFYGPEDAEQYSFYRIPKRLISGEEFQEISMDSKLLHGLMLDRLHEDRRARGRKDVLLCRCCSRTCPEDRRHAKVLAEESFYRQIPKKGLRFSTKVSMMVSDRLKMVKMIHLRLE